MKNKPLVIIGSARLDGNTNHFVFHMFKKNNYEEINLLNYHISPYNYDGTYPQDDQFDSLVVEMLGFQTIIFATPVYWYAMSGPMKTLFDRFTDLVTKRKEIGRVFKGKTISLIATGSDPELPEGFEVPFKLTADYLEMDYKQRIYFTEKDKNLSNKKQLEVNTFLNQFP